MSATGTASVTSLNFQGFEDFARNGTSPILFNQIYIQQLLVNGSTHWLGLCPDNSLT